MDEKRARQLIQQERVRLTELLNQQETAPSEDVETAYERGSYDDGPALLTVEATDEAITETIRDRLGSLDRAEQRLAAGTFGRSVQSGLPIPDERLEADPAAELTVEEAARQGR
jgi:DnaK suppressor protein